MRAYSARRLGIKGLRKGSIVMDKKMKIEALKRMLEELESQEAGDIQYIKTSNSITALSATDYKWVLDLQNKIDELITVVNQLKAQNLR